MQRDCAKHLSLRCAAIVIIILTCSPVPLASPQKDIELNYAGISATDWPRPRFSEFHEKRALMVDNQIARHRPAVRNNAVLEAMRQVPRHLFVPGYMRGVAHADRPLPIGHGQTISQPYMVAVMTELLDPQPDQRVLEIGTGSGYQAAILAELVRSVFTVERIPELARSAQETFDRLGYDNILQRVGDGSVGWKQYAPYDRIVVTAGAPAAPDSLKTQLAEGGRLVIPTG